MWHVVNCAVQVRAGMAHTHFTLHPGETVRTPSILTLFWQGERMRGNNLLRRFLLAHHRPHPNGKPLVLPVLIERLGRHPGDRASGAIDRIAKHDSADQVVLDRRRVVWRGALVQACG